jgi:hypothetical protein
MDLKQRMQETQANRALVAEEMINGLMNGQHVLITSQPGAGKVSLAKAVAEKIGLKVVHLEPAGQVDQSIPTPISKQEAAIIAILEKQNGNAILLDMFAKDNVSAVFNVANQLNLPLIVCATTNTSDSGLKISVKNDRNHIKSIVDALPSLETQDFQAPKALSQNMLNRLKTFRLDDSDLDDSNKPKPK